MLDSLDKTDAEIEALWIKESEGRYQAYKDGKLQGIPLEQIRARIES
ncbi:MAG: addiction module protein [Desulfuromusa sp.]